MRNLEESFGKYIDSEEAEKIFSNIFSEIRKAYIAGYRAAQNDKLNNANRELIQLVPFPKNERSESSI